jgi:hypothetical protein
MCEPLRSMGSVRKVTPNGDKGLTFLGAFETTPGGMYALAQNKSLPQSGLLSASRRPTGEILLPNGEIVLSIADF